MSERADLQARLLSAIAEWDAERAPDVGADTPLISSGRLDSFNLVRLVLWVEEEIGSPVDATAIDLAVDWDTVELIAEFVARRRATNGR